MPLFMSDDRQPARAQMIDQQLVTRQIHDERVLAAMRRVPRHRFVPKTLQNEAYADRALPIGLEQTISQPYVIAQMLQVLALIGTEIVLEIGTGSGYQTALLAGLVQRVYSIERHPALAQSARAQLTALGITNVEIITGDGSLGLPAQAPFDAIMIAAATPALPMAILAQLRDPGRLVAPIGDRALQYIERVTRHGSTWTIEQLTPVVFVPLIGAGGFTGASISEGAGRRP